MSIERHRSVGKMCVNVILFLVHRITMLKQNFVARLIGLATWRDTGLFIRLVNERYWSTNSCYDAFDMLSHDTMLTYVKCVYVHIWIAESLAATILSRLWGK